MDNDREQYIENIYNTILYEIVEKEMGNYMTFGSQLEDFGNKMLGKNFIGVYPSDKIPKMKKQQMCIVNLDESDKPGSHWISMYQDEKTLVYDSFARETKSILPKYKNEQTKDSDISDREQDLDEDNCGQRCLSWLIVAKYWGPQDAMLI